MNSSTFLRFWFLPVLSFSLGLALILGHTEWAMGSECPLAQLNQLSVSTPRQEVRDFLKVLQSAKQLAAGKSEDCREKILFAAMHFNLEMIDSYHESHEAEIEKAGSNEYKDIEKEIAEAGWTITFPDGIFEIVPSETWILVQLKNQLPTAWQKYLSNLENERTAVKGDQVVVPWENLGDRLVSWYEFSKAYPKFSLKDEVQSKISGYSHIYFFGVREKEDTIPLERFAAYEKFLMTYPKSDLKPAVELYVDSLKKTQNKITQTIRESLLRKLAEIDLK